jgi:anti-sigma factor RsiW
MSMRKDLEPITLERLRALVDAYGANLGRIPETERAACQALLEHSDAARALWEEAKMLDGLLSHAPSELEPSARLLASLKALPERTPQGGTLVTLLPRRTWAFASLAAAAALVLGVFSGRESRLQTSDESARVELTSSDGDTLSELGALALADELMTDLDQLEGDAE